MTRAGPPGDGDGTCPDAAVAAAAVLYASGARRVWLFGSHVKRPDTDTQSDVDLAVEGLPAAVVDGAGAAASRAAGVHVDAVAMETASALLRWTLARHRILIPRVPVGRAAPNRAHGLQAVRIATVTDILRTEGSRRVLDLGCGRGDLLTALAGAGFVDHVTGVDLDEEALAHAARRLRRRGAASAAFVQALVTAWHPAFAGHDAAVAVEVIEHLPPSVVPAFEHVVFARVRPAVAVVTTPNREHNARWATDHRHRDHCFEWTRAEFGCWARAAGVRHGYEVTITGVGTHWRDTGPPTQLALFRWRGRRHVDGGHQAGPARAPVEHLIELSHQRQGREVP